MRAPGVTIGSRRLGALDRRAIAVFLQAKPQRHAIEKQIDPANLAVNFEKVMREVNRRARQLVIVQKRFDDVWPTAIGDAAAKQREALRVLAEGLLRVIFCE